MWLCFLVESQGGLDSWLGHCACQRTQGQLNRKPSVVWLWGLHRRIRAVWERLARFFFFAMLVRRSESPAFCAAARGGDQPIFRVPNCGKAAGPPPETHLGVGTCPGGELPPGPRQGPQQWLSSGCLPDWQLALSSGSYVHGKLESSPLKLLAAIVLWALATRLLRPIESGDRLIREVRIPHGASRGLPFRGDESGFCGTGVGGKERKLDSWEGSGRLQRRAQRGEQTGKLPVQTSSTGPFHVSFRLSPFKPPFPGCHSSEFSASTRSELRKFKPIGLEGSCEADPRELGCRGCALGLDASLKPPDLSDFSLCPGFFHPSKPTRCLPRVCLTLLRKRAVSWPCKKMNVVM